MPEDIKPRGVVVGTDGSPCSLVAVRWAAHEAVMRHAGLHIVHVVSSLAFPVSTLAWPAGRVPDEVLEIQENEARNAITDAVAGAREAGGDTSLEVSCETVHGGAVPTLAGQSDEAQLLVVGCHGRTGRHRRLLGSVSTGLISHAHCPVAVVHEEFSETPESAQLPVVVGIDGSRTSESATAIAFNEASWRGVPLVAVHVWSDADLLPIDVMGPAGLQRAADRTLADCLAGWLDRFPEVPVTKVVRFHDPVGNLLEQAEHAQLVVIGSHGRGGFAGMVLGSVGAAVAQAAHAPVIIARKR